MERFARGGIIRPLFHVILGAAFFCLAHLPLFAFAEGTAETGPRQGLDGDTVLYVDIIDDSENFYWSGNSGITVYTPTGVLVGHFEDGELVPASPGITGAYRVELDADQFIGDGTGVDVFYDWDITVLRGTTPQLGRVWSYYWDFNAGSFFVENATDANYYALIPGGGPGTSVVIELDLEGLAGFLYSIQANRAGPLIGGEYAGQSIPEPAWITRADEYPIYLNPPARADYSYIVPEVSDFDWNGWLGSGDGDCEAVVPGEGPGSFSFTTNVNGTYHIICDLNHDEEFNFVSVGDLHLIGETTPGTNFVDWDGTNNAGEAVDPDAYECQVMVTVGEFHYVGRDIETSYLGIRMYEVWATDFRNPLRMFWNDSLVQDNARTMRNNQIPAETSGLAGVHSGPHGSVAIPHTTTVDGNSRAWGNFLCQPPAPTVCSPTDAGLGKGNRALLDTYTWVDADVSGTITIRVVTGTEDSDGEGLPDFVEECLLGTDPSNPDSDGDWIDDFEETDHFGSPEAIDTDGDGTIDALDEDSDDDGVRDVDEAGDSSTTTPARDTDSDGTPDYRDVDDDGDTVPTVAEDIDGDEDPLNDDSDGDDIPDYLDPDDDDDGLLTEDEDVDGDGDPRNDDTDGDGTPNYLDADDDGDGLLTEDEDVDEDGDVTNDDTDGDGVPNYLDPNDDDGPLGDIDGDGVPNGDDNCIYTANPEQEDVNDNGIGDACEDDWDSDGILNDGDSSGDHEDNPCVGGETVDCDDNCPFTSNPDQSDLDGDGVGDVCDEDSDGDGVDDDGDGSGDPTDNPCESGETEDCDDNCPHLPNPDQADSDGDGVGDACEEDPDADGILSDGDDSDDPSDNPCGDGELTDCDDNCPTVSNPDQADTDGDGLGDACDPDIDNDGILNDGDSSGSNDDNPCADGESAGCDDNCVLIENADQADFDGDGVGDVCDNDADGDGVASDDDCDDLDPTVSENSTFFSDADNDGWGDSEESIEACGEAPEGYSDAQPDNCPSVSNSDQDDRDEDGVGDACDECPDDAGTASYLGCPPRNTPAGSGCSCRATSAAAPQGAISTLILLLAFVLFRRKPAN